MRIKNRQRIVKKAKSKRNTRISSSTSPHHTSLPPSSTRGKLKARLASCRWNGCLRVRPRAIESRPMRPRTSRDHGDFSRALAEIPPNTSSSPTIRISICIIIRYIMESYGINMESLDLGIWNRHPMGDWAYRPKWQGWTMTPCCLCISMEIMDAWSTGIYQGRIQKSSLLFFIR